MMTLMPDKTIYTPEQANEMLPWLTGQLEHLMRLTNELRTLQGSLEAIDRRARGNGHRDISGDLSAANERADRVTREARRVLEEITGRGIQVRDVDIGLIDFPGERDGTPVWLCWKLGEAAVAHWHEYDQGFSSRKPL
jgi:hypothetical protein